MMMDEICEQKPGTSSGCVVKLGVRTSGRQWWHAGFIGIENNLCTRGTCTTSIGGQLTVAIGKGTECGNIEMNSLEGVEFTCSSGVWVG